MAITIIRQGPETRDVFLAQMAKTFPAAAVRRKELAWDWIFARRLGADRQGSFVLAAESRGAFVGGSIQGVSLYQCDGREHVAYSPYGTNVDPTVRGLGLSLVKALYQIPTLALGIPNEDKLANVNARLGAISKPRVQMFRVLRAGRVLGRKRPWAAPFAAAGDALWRLGDAGLALARPRLARDEVITTETSFGREHDAFWERARAVHPFIQVRDAAFMTWRYVDAPMQDYEVLVLRRSGVVRGFVVIGSHIDPDQRFGQITDVLVEDDDVRSIALLLSAASDRLARLGAEVACLGCCTNPALEAAARRASFFHSKPSRPAQASHADTTIRERMVAGIGALYLTRADQDEDY
jgi:hypothetical protein